MTKGPDNPFAFGLPPEEMDLILKRIQAKQALAVVRPEVADKYRGSRLFAELNYIRPLAPQEAPVTIGRALNGTLVPWHSDRGTAALQNQLFDTSSPFSKSIAAALDYPETPHSNQVFDQFSNKLTQFEPKVIFGTAAEQKEFWYLIQLMGHAYSMVQQKQIFDTNAFNEDRLTPSMNTFTDNLEQVIEDTSKQIESSTKTDLVPFIAFYDLTEADVLNNLAYARNRHGKYNPRVPNELYACMEQAGSEGRTKWAQDLQYMGITNEIHKKWREMMVDLDGAEITMLLNILPTLQTANVKISLLDELDDYLQLDHTTNPLKPSPEALVALAHNDIPSNIPDDEITYRSFEDPESKESLIEVNGLTLPKKLTPATTVHFLTQLLTSMNPDESLDFLAKMQKVAVRKGNPIGANINEWLLLLTLISAGDNPILKGHIKGFVGQRDFPHPPFKEVFLNQKPGKVWLLPEGGIKVSAGKDLTNAHCIYTSEYQPDTNQKAPKIATIPAPLPTFRQPLEILRPHRPFRTIDPEQTIHEKTIDQKVGGHYQIMFPGGKGLSVMGEGLSETDLAIVKKAIDDYTKEGRHRIEGLRAKTTVGERQFKMRINGQSSGIRIIFQQVEGRKIVVNKISYRKESTYKF